jgi:hypothetical protein
VARAGRHPERSSPTVASYEGAKREFRDFGASRGERELAVSKPWHSAVAVTLCQFIVIPRW